MSITLNVPILNSIMDSIHQTSPPRPNSLGSSGYGSYHALHKTYDDESDLKDDAKDDKKDHKDRPVGNRGMKNIALRTALLVLSVLLNIALLCFIFAFIFDVGLFSGDDEHNKQWTIINSNYDRLLTTEGHQKKMEDYQLRKHSSLGLCQYSATKYLHNLLILVRIHSSLWLFFNLSFCAFFKFTVNNIFEFLLINREKYPKIAITMSILYSHKLHKIQFR